MSERRAAFLIVPALVAAACGSPEARVVDQYFNALKVNDQQTLTSFALVGFDKKVDSWAVKSVGEETRIAATLPDLVSKVSDLEAQRAANKKEAQTYSLNNYSEIERVREIEKKAGRVPANLQSVAEAWKKYNDTDRELAKAVADAKEAVDKERRNAVLSVGNRDDVDSMTGEVVSKRLEVDLTIGGQVHPYVMTLRKYDVTISTGPRIVSKWVVQSIEPKA